MEGARLRRNVLRGAVMVFVSAGYSSKRFILEKAKELGVRSVVIDGPQSWSKASVDGCVWWWGVGEARGCLGVCVHRGRWLVSWACH